MKVRADVLLVEQGLVPSREQAQRYILAGLVHSSNRIIDKVGMKLDQDEQLFIKELLIPYVSRGGVKLAGALEAFQVDLTDLVVVDVGSSTGGFTDCALQHGAQRVYAIDVTNHLDWRLQQDPRVVVMAQCNFRYLDPATFPERVDLAVVDVSFISLNLIFPNLSKITKDDGRAIVLIKPQFEAGREQVGKKGVIREEKVLVEVLEKVIGYAANSGFTITEIIHSPLRGKKEGNIEFLGYCQKKALPTVIAVEKVVSNAYNFFKEKGKDRC